MPDLEEEIDLIKSCLLASESVEWSPSQLVVTSSTHPLSIQVSNLARCHDRDKDGNSHETDGRPRFQIKSDTMNRDQAHECDEWVNRVVDEHWDEVEQGGYPIFSLISEHFLPLLQAPLEESSLLSTWTSAPTATTVDHSADNSTQNRSGTAYQPAHILFSSHHLLAPSKRKDLHSLSHQLHLVGFAKVGYPGIIFAQGDYDDLQDFAREVKSWQWLALKLRVLEPVLNHPQSGIDSAKPSKGKWEEVHKVGEAVDWLKAIGKQHLLLDIGIGSSGRPTQKP